MNSKPVIFLTFANDHQGRFLEALRPEQDGINVHLAKFQQEGGIVYHPGSSEPDKILAGLNQFTGQLCVFHFSGHSDGVGLQFESLQGDSIQFHGANIGSILKQEAQSNLKLVFLNACLTDGLIETLQEIGVPAIIATASTISDAKAQTFSIAFYRSLASGNSLKTAFEQAKAIIEPDDATERIFSLRGFERNDPSTQEFPWGLHVLNEGILDWKLPKYKEEASPAISNTVEGILGDKNIIVEGVSDSTITINVNGDTREIQKELDELKALLMQNQAKSFLAAGKQFDIHALNENNFDFVVQQSQQDKSLPEDLEDQLITDRNRWIQSLQQELKTKQRIAVSNNPQDVIKHFGWLIETYLTKMLSGPGRQQSLYAFSFMTEAWNSSLRYLCYIQMAQILKDQNLDPDRKVQKDIKSILTPFLRLAGKKETGELPREVRFDYLGLLTSLNTHSVAPFVPQMEKFMKRLLDTESTLYATSLFLEAQRNRLIQGEVKAVELESLMPRYLTGLTYWLRNISFLAHYRMVSIKDINLSYRLGTGQSFDHLFGELHGIYSGASSEENIKSVIVDEHFTYNHSILLMDGKDVDTCMQKIHDPDSYLSLSPLLIDQVFLTAKKA